MFKKDARKGSTVKKNKSCHTVNQPKIFTDVKHNTIELVYKLTRKQILT